MLYQKEDCKVESTNYSNSKDEGSHAGGAQKWGILGTILGGVVQAFHYVFNCRRERDSDREIRNLSERVEALNNAINTMMQSDRQFN